MTRTWSSTKTRKCIVCGAEFTLTAAKQMRCEKHKNVHRRRTRVQQVRPGRGIDYGSPNTCEKCGATYKPTTGAQRLCRTCRMESSTEMATRKLAFRARRPVALTYVPDASSAPRTVWMTREIRIARSAGFFDGEGCVSIGVQFKPHKVYFKLEISAFQAIRAPLEDFVALWGGKIKNRGDGWRWWQIGANAIPALQDMLPYLQVKQNQARLALEFQSRKLSPGATYADRAAHLLQEESDFWNIKLLRESEHDYR